MRDYSTLKNRSANSKKIEKLASAESPKSGTQDEIRKAQNQTRRSSISSTTLTPWQRTQLAVTPASHVPRLYQRTFPRISELPVIAASATIARLWADSPASTIARS